MARPRPGARASVLGTLIMYLTPDQKYEINVRVLTAIDNVIAEVVGIPAKPCLVKDRHLPDFLPHLERLLDNI